MGSGRPSAAPKTLPKRWGAKPPHPLEWFWGPPGPPRPQKSTICGRPQNHVLKTQQYYKCRPGSRACPGYARRTCRSLLGAEPGILDSSAVNGPTGLRVPAPPDRGRHTKEELTLDLLIRGFGAGRKSSMFGVWAAPKPLQKVGGFAPHLWNGVWGRRGRPNTKNRRFPAGPKIMYEEPKCKRKKKLQEGFCRQKHSHRNTASKLGAGRAGNPTGNPRKTTRNDKAHRNSGTLPRPNVVSVSNPSLQAKEELRRRPREPGFWTSATRV